MRKIFLFVVACVLSVQSFCQTPATDSGTYLLHKFAQNIGTEKFKVKKDAGITTYDVQFRYVDRGQPVELSASLALNTSLQPLQYFIKGGTSRFSQLNDTIRIRGTKAEVKIDSVVSMRTIPATYFTVAGYSPATTQMLLIKYWKQHKRPSVIPVLPQGNIYIKKDGEDTMLFNGKNIRLERYVITGLIWGNELLWTDASGQLYCLITNDAEGDKQEMMYEPYESLLPNFIERAAVYGMKLFTKAAKPNATRHDIILIKNGNVVDVVNGNTTASSVLIQNGIIKKIGMNISAPKGAFIIDAKGKTILPGLFDMHAHFQQAEWGPAYLAAGVTTGRDCGNEFEYINAVKNAIDKGEGIGPHILKAGIIDGKGQMALGIVQADTREEAIAAVDRYKENGYVQIKIYSSVKPEIIKAICDEAHRLGLTVTGHVPEEMNLLQAADSGMNMFNHIQYVLPLLKRKKDRTIDFNDSANRAVFDHIKANNISIDPTLGVFELALRNLKGNITDIEPNFTSLPQPLQTIFKNTGLSEEDYNSYGKRVFDIFKRIFKQLYDAGIPMVAGTDMGFPGYSLHRELEIYVDCGITPMQAIQLATIAPARMMKIDSEYGSIEVNKKADIVIVDGDPVKAIQKIRNVHTVIKDGTIYDPVSLHKMAGFTVQ